MITYGQVLLEQLESEGTETFCQSYSAGYTVIVYQLGKKEFSVQYDDKTHNAESIQEIGTSQVIYL